MDPPLIFPLADVHPSILQRIIDLSADDDLFLLRPVARRFRDAVDRRVRQLRPSELPADLGSRFPGLVSLDLQHFFIDDITARLTAVVPKLPKLRELLNLSVRDADRHAEWLPALQPLTRLSFYEVWDADVFLAVTAHCYSLERLQLLRGRISSDNLHAMVAPLAGTLTVLDARVTVTFTEEQQRLGLLPLNTGRLRALRLHLHSGGPDVFSQLAAFDSLTRLQLDIYHSVGHEGIEQLNALTRLTALLLDNGVSLTALTKLTRLTRVACLRSPGISGPPAHLGAALAGFPGLTSLDISFYRDLDVGSALRALPGLKRLTADASGLLIEPQALAGLSQLEELRLPLCHLHEAQLERLSDLVRLTRLDLSSPQDAATLSEEGGRWLARLTALQQLSLCGWVGISSAALEQLARLPALQALDLCVKQQLPPLAPRECLPLSWLRIMSDDDLSQEQLPSRLQVALLKARSYHWLLDEDDLMVC